MSTTVDQRVVEMRFDNKQFEAGVSTTMSTLDKLKQSLNLTGAAKGLENVGTAAKGINLSGLGSAVETVQAKFSALGVIGVTALANITNSAVNAGKRMISALTIDPITTGFSEYETKINAIQTIMSNTASKGTTMDDVTRVLGELNTYADKTIYNFAEMTRNIGTFTAAGVGLEDSAAAIQGIANLAAMSGSNSQQASTAMYQLSQAMASGTVKLMDWNSVVNAGMGGELFQNALKETARAHGVAVDEIIKRNGSFRESLHEGWITTDILTETLAKMTKSGAAEYLSELTGVEQSQIEAAQKLVAENKNGTASYEELAAQLAASGKITKEEALGILQMADNAEDAATKIKTFTQLWDTLKESAQSGWSQTWEILVGDFEEAKETLTEFSEVIGGMITASAEARNKVLGAWKNLGGRADLVDSFFNIFEAIMSFVTPIKEAFREIFLPETTGEMVKKLVDLTESFKEFTAKLKLSENASNNLKQTFKGIFAVFDIVGQAISAVFNAIRPLFGSLDNLGGGVLGVTASWGDWLVKLSDTIRETDIFNKALGKVSTILTTVIDVVKKFYNAFKEKFAVPGLEAIQALIDRIRERMASIGDTAEGLSSIVSSAWGAMAYALANCDFMKLLQTLWNGIKTIGSGIAEALGALTGGLIDKLGNANFGGIFDLINSISFAGIGVFFAKFVNGFSDITESIGSFKDSALDILTEVRGCFEAYQTSLKAETLKKIATAIAILAGAILVISLIDSNKLSASLGAITVLFADLMGSMAIFGKLSGDLTGVFKASYAITSLSKSLLVLAIALKIMSTMSWEEMGIGLISLVAGLGALVGAVNLLPEGKMTNAAKAIQKLSKALVVLAIALKIMGSMSWQEMGVALISMTVGLGALVGAVNLLPDEKLAGAASALIKMSAALVILAAAIKILSTMSWQEMGIGLISLVVGLGALVGAVNLLPKDTALRAMGMIGLAAAMVVLAGALKIMGSMSWEEIAKGFVALGSSMLILAFGLNAMQGTFGGAAALLIAAAALTVLTPVLATLGLLSWEQIAKGLITIAGAFAVIGIAGLILQPLIPAILGLAGSIALLGVGILAIGAGLTLTGLGLSAIAIGFGALCTAIAGGATSIVAGLTIIITGIANLIPLIIQKIGEGIIAFCGVIAEGAPAIGAAFKAVVLSLIDVLVSCIPAIAEGALQLLVGVYQALVEYGPQLVELLFQFLISVIDGLAAKMPELIQSVVNLLASAFSGILQALGSLDFTTVISSIAGIGLLVGIMYALSGLAALVPAAMVGVLGLGLLVAELAIVLGAIGLLAQIPGLEWLINEGGQFMQSIGTAIGQFVGGIIGGVAKGVTAVLPQIGSDLSAFMTNISPFIAGAQAVDASVITGAGYLAGAILAITAADIIAGVASFLTGGTSFAQLGTELSAFMTNAMPFIAGAALLDASMMEGVESLAKVIMLLTGAGILDGLTSWLTGGVSLADFGAELAAFGPYMATYAESVAGIDATAVTASANAAKSLSEMAANLPNSGGLVGWFTGENDMATFGTQLSAFGAAIKSYSLAVVGLDVEAINASIPAVKALSGMAEAIPNFGGMVSWFTGDNDLATFGSQLVVFGDSITSYSESVTGLNTDAITTSVSAAKSLSELASTLENSGGMVSWFTGDNDLGTFGDSLVELGDAMADFSSSLADVNTNKIRTAVSQINDLIDLAERTEGTDFAGLADFGDALGEIGTDGAKDFIAAFENAYDDANAAGTDFVAKLIDGVDSQSTTLSTTVSGMSTAAGLSARNAYATFYQAGAYLAVGFASGISLNAFVAEAAARSMAASAAEGAKNELDEHSPSRVGYKIGDFFGLGFVNAVRDYASIAYKASTSMASAARTGLSDAIGRIRSFIDSDIDAQPTIRPVLDLSDVQAGADSIGGLFKNGPSVGVLANVGAINSMMNRRNQNGANADVVSAIDKLNKKMDNFGNTTYSINGVTYDDGSNVSDAVRTLVRAAKIERRV